MAEETADQGREDHEEDAEATASAFMPIVAAAAAYSDRDIGDGDDSDIDDPLPLFRRGRNNVPYLIPNRIPNRNCRRFFKEIKIKNALY